MKSLSILKAVVLAAFTMVCGTVVQAVLPPITIETVTVGNAGNAADTQVMTDSTTGYGAVGYSYAIGTYEVTNTQYTAFLNAKAKTDTFSLYNEDMGSRSMAESIAQAAAAVTSTRRRAALRTSR